MNSFFLSWKIATAYLSLTLFGCIAVSNFSLTKGVGVFLEKVSMFPCTRDDPWQKPPLQMIFPIQLVSFRDLKCLWSMVLQRPCFLFRNFKEKWKKIEPSKVDKAYFTRYRLLFFFSRHGISFKTISGEAKSITEEMILKLHCQQFSPDTRFKIFLTQMNLVCFINARLRRRIILITKSSQEASIAIFAYLGWPQLM